MDAISEVDVMKETPAEILSNTFDNKVELNNDQQQTVDVSCLTAQNLHGNLMDSDVSPSVSRLLDDVMNVIYGEVPRSVLQDLINTDDMKVKKGGPPSLQPGPISVEAQYPSSQGEQYHEQGTGSCSKQTFDKGVENTAIGVGRNEVSSDFVRTVSLSPEKAESAGHSTPSYNGHLTQSAHNDIIAYLKGPGHSTGGLFNDPIGDNQKNSIPDGAETPLLQKTVGTHVTLATGKGRPEDKRHQARHCDDALARRRQQNRKAAKKCRDKRLQNLKGLEQRVKLLQQRSYLTEVRQQLLQVRTRLNQHWGDNRA
ncbi:uncharacterized protein [Haliotis asinina]|uniref:uncharacterized protein n=1 Tax=Haliotis asinina TaxID=109174 RepID=UPI0035318AC1